MSRASFNLYLLGFNLYLQGFNLYLLGFNLYLQGFNLYLLGFNLYLLGFNLYLLGFNLYLQRFNLYLHWFSLYLQGFFISRFHCHVFLWRFLMSTIAKCLRKTDCDVVFSFLLSAKKANTNKGCQNLFTSRSLVPGYFKGPFSYSCFIFSSSFWL